MEELASPLPLPALRLLVPPVQLVSAAVWQTVQQGVVADYGMLEEFVSMVTDMVPELLSRQQRAELTLGLRARLILDLLRSEGTADVHTLQPHLDRMGELVGAWLTDSRAADVDQQPDSDFLDLMKLLLNSREERQRYFQDVFPEQFGASFDAALRALMWLLLTRLEKFLPLPTFQQVASRLGQVSSVLEEVAWSRSEELRTLLRYHRHLSLLDPDGKSPPAAAEALKIAAQARAASSASPPQTQSDVVPEVQDAGVPVAAEEEEGPGVVKECSILLRRLEEPTAASRPRPARANRGGKMKMILLEEKRDVEAEESDQDAASDEDSWSHYSSQTSLASLDSWSHYSSDDPSYTSPVRSPSPDLLLSGCSSDERFPSAPRKAPSISRPAAPLPPKPPKKRQPAQCCICKETVETKLSAHMKTHFPDGEFACPRCDGRFKLFSSLKLHLKRICFEHEEQAGRPDGPDGPAGPAGPADLFRCGQCPQAFRYKLSLEVHARTHHELYCAVCRKVLRDGAALARHRDSHTPYQCTRCEATFTIFKHLLRHCENVHKMGRPLRCGHCPKVFSKLRLLIGHEWKHTGRLPFQCSQCSMKFKNDTDLVSHQRVHTREKPYLCSECGKTFSQRSNLLRHLQFVHSESRHEKKHSCSECDKSFKEKGALIKHQRTKHYNELFRHPCPYCGKMFSASAIARHKLIHTGERPFRCSVPDCERRFRSTPEVKKHVLMHHSDERPFKCGVCGKGFVKPCFLNSHSKIHSGEKPFVCLVCGKAFLKRYSMLRHKRLLHTQVDS